MPLVTISPIEENPSIKLRHLLADAWAFNHHETSAILDEFLGAASAAGGDDDSDKSGRLAVANALETARNEERIIDDFSQILPKCDETDRIPRWWRQCVHYLQKFALIEVADGHEMDPESWGLRCSSHMQQRLGALVFAKLGDEVRHCVEISASLSPGSTFNLTDVAHSIALTAQANSRPQPLEQEITKESGNLNMWFIMDAWDASSKVMVMDDPINTTLNFLDVYNRYLECPALLVLYMQVLRDCSVAAANCLLQDKFMESEMPAVKDVGKYITEVILPLLRVTRAQWERSEESTADDAEEALGGRNLHWSRAKRCFGCGSDGHALNNCTVVPSHCTLEELEKIRADAVVPEGYKWRAAKTVLKMHKYSAVTKEEKRGDDSFDDPDDSFMGGFREQAVGVRAAGERTAGERAGAPADRVLREPRESHEREPREPRERDLRDKPLQREPSVKRESREPRESRDSLASGPSRLARSDSRAKRGHKRRPSEITNRDVNRDGPKGRHARSGSVRAVGAPSAASEARKA